MSSIVVISGKSRGFRFHLVEEPVTVGRDETCDLQVLDDLVSRKHMQIRFDNTTGDYDVEDLKSANGVFVDNQRITDNTVLQDGDVIMIGDSKLVFTTQEFADDESALNYFKTRGERGRSTMIAQPDDEVEGS